MEYVTYFPITTSDIPFRGAVGGDNEFGSFGCKCTDEGGLNRVLVRRVIRYSVWCRFGNRQQAAICFVIDEIVWLSFGVIWMDLLLVSREMVGPRPRLPPAVRCGGQCVSGVSAVLLATSGMNPMLVGMLSEMGKWAHLPRFVL